LSSAAPRDVELGDDAERKANVWRLISLAKEETLVRHFNLFWNI
jgi:hypothetical protein